MRLGILVESEEGLDWDSWRATYLAAERLGFESVWLSDHLQSPWTSTTPRHRLEPWTALAVAAAETERVVLGPLVSPVTFREPVIMARMAETIDSVSHGRFVLGLGLGWNAAEHAAGGIPFPSVKERGKKLTEAIERVRCEVRVPILIGGGGPRATLPLVARYADEWNLTTASVQQYRTASDELDRLCTAIGRNPRAINRSAAMGMLIGRDAADLEQRARAMVCCVPPLAEQADVLQAARDMGWLVGTPEQVVNTLDELAEAGVERAILGHYNLADLSMLELVAETVLR